MQDESGHQQEKILADLRERVIQAMGEEQLPDRDTMIQLAQDYRSYQRMGHAPARARKLAEQIAFQQRWYLDEKQLAELGLSITATLADIYERRLAP